MMKSDKALLLAGGMLMSLTLAPLRAAAQDINCGQPIIFGTMVACTGASEVTIQPSGARSKTGCVTLVPGFGRAGKCNFIDFTGGAVDVSAPSSVVLNRDGGGATMQLTDFNLLNDDGGRSIVITNPSSTPTIPVGATLNIQANQPSGAYSGSFTITTNYQ